ncbi:MAG: polyphosphate kinase 1, partial [Erysipelothrix sp.]|nr:polyphosphate kinase 1 [Erysipelothrix sp.]
FRVRVGALLDQSLLEHYLENDVHHEELLNIMDWIANFEPQVNHAYHTLEKDLEAADIKLVNIKQLSKIEENQLKRIWQSEVKPYVVGQILRNDLPFPFLQNGKLYVVVTLLSKQKKQRYGLVSLENLPSHFYFEVNGIQHVVSAVDLIEYHLSEIFSRFKIQEVVVVRVTRNADIDVEISLMDDDVDFRGQLEKLVAERSTLGAVRLQLDRHVSQPLENYLLLKIECAKELLVINEYKLDLRVGFELYDVLKKDFPSLVYPAQPSIQQFDFSVQRVMEALKTRDTLIAYPYHSSNSFVQLLHEAANEPLVESIRISLYRVANPSRIISALMFAAEKGKQVTVVLELRARFDEERNIENSKRLEEAGCHVIYGIPDYKVHAKVCVIQMKNNQYITYVATGNFNEKTQNQYTDLALITTELSVGEDSVEMFNSIERETLLKRTQSIWIAPLLFRNKLVEEIDEEISFGEEGLIVMKMNSLNDELIMNKLIEASQAGVKVQLLVRGICCLIPGIPGVSENITVKSIVGRYLEHSRIYKFGSVDRAKFFIGSGDLLHRNTQR